MKLKEEYKDKKISYNGITYDFKNLNEEKLEKIWTYNKDLRFLFEEKVEPAKFDPIVEKLSEEEFFNASVKSYLKDKKLQSFEEKFDPETKPQKIEKLYTPKPKSIPKKK